MSLAAIILILVIGVSGFDLFVGISDLTKYLHQSCLNFTPESSYSEIYASLVCGKSLVSHEFSQNLKNLGIYHVIVVSGSHLIFLSVLIEKLFYWQRLRKLRYAAFPILLLYSLATGAEPPVIRALISISINRLQEQKKLFWNQSEVIFISLLICLCMSQSWQTSYSLLLSYVASLILSLVGDKNALSKNLWIYILILPFLLPLSAPSPLSFLTNMTLTPFIGAVLFPLSFLSFVIPYFHHLVDPLWKIFLGLCSIVGPELSNLNPIAIPLNILWVAAIIMNFYGIYSVKKRIL